MSLPNDVVADLAEFLTIRQTNNPEIETSDVLMEIDSIVNNPSPQAIAPMNFYVDATPRNVIEKTVEFITKKTATVAIQTDPIPPVVCPLAHISRSIEETLNLQRAADVWISNGQSHLFAKGGVTDGKIRKGPPTRVYLPRAVRPNCWNCDGVGHQRSTCPLRKKGINRACCYLCGFGGVTAKTCPNCGPMWRAKGPYHFGQNRHFPHAQNYE